MRDPWHSTHDAGRAAYRAGTSYMANPYARPAPHFNLDLKRAWSAGWLHERDKEDHYD